jgi:uroporphyrinogen III methyltransferase/synthase
VTVYLVGAGPGDPGLLTRRAVRILRRADVVIYDRLVPRAALAFAPDSAELIDMGKRPGAQGSQRQEEINRLLVEHGRRSHNVVRLKGGDPFVFGRGGEEAEVLTEAGIEWEAVPGVSSAFGVPSSLGIPVTHRGVASSVTVATGRVGDVGAPGAVDWQGLAKVEGTLVILMGMSTRAEIAAALIEGGKAPDTPVAVIEQGTTAAERSVRTTLAELGEVSLGSPAVIVVGPVAALGLSTPPAAVGPLHGRTVVVTRAAPRAKGLVTALEGVGASVIEMPLTTQADPSDGGRALQAAASEVSTYRWVLFTSANAVHRFLGAVRDARAFGPALIAGVGPASADALRMNGIEPDLIPPEHWAQGLVEVFPERGDGENERVLFPCADLTPSTVVDGLAEKGWVVTKVEAYRTVDLPSAPPELLEQVARADVVTFTASSSIRAYKGLRTPDGATLPVPPCVVCIGPVTTETAVEEGMTGVLTAWGASAEGMVDVLVDHFASGHGADS